MFFKLVIIIFVVYLLFRLLKKGSSDRGARSAYSSYQKPVTGEDLVEDPVCHTYIPVSAALKINANGKTLYFCSQKCLDRYLSENKG